MCFYCTKTEIILRLKAKNFDYLDFTSISILAFAYDFASVRKIFAKK